MENGIFSFPSNVGTLNDYSVYGGIPTAAAAHSYLPSRVLGGSLTAEFSSSNSFYFHIYINSVFYFFFFYHSVHTANELIYKAKKIRN